MAVAKESLEKLKERIDLVEVISTYVPMKSAGAAYKACCPFHEEKTPSFVVKKGDSHYHCFGCGAHGDAIAFLMNHLSVTFQEAVEMLAERFGVMIEQVEKTEKGPDKKRMKEALQLTSELYHFYLLHTDQGHHALRYLYDRGIDLDFIRHFGVGLAPCDDALFFSVMKEKGFPPPLLTLLQTTLADEVPAKLTDGNVMRHGVSPELDELRSIKDDAQSYLENYQETLRQELGIKTLKVSYNKAFGYYIDVSRAQSSKMPSSFEKRQTLVNNERFISPELKTFEAKILSAADRIAALEAHLFETLTTNVADSLDTIQTLADIIAHLDAHLALAQVASLHRYTRPEIHTGNELHIEAGRHPLLDTPAFVPNDVHFTSSEKLLILTGPNMAGKSTYIRQVALITIMAQIGSFVPACFASIGIVDQVFSRIGASDDLMRGQSTFMVEMLETAAILNNATEKSLIILDEIGRGTSTYDGIAIASAVAESLANTKTLFATHYFELTKLPETCLSAKNLRVAVDESGDSIAFLHKIVPGGADKSYGIHVARLAGIPAHVLRRAEEHLLDLEHQKKTNDAPQQLELFQEVRSERENPLKNIDPDALSPREALELLYALKIREN